MPSISSMHRRTSVAAVALVLVLLVSAVARAAPAEAQAEAGWSGTIDLVGEGPNVRGPTSIRWEFDGVADRVERDEQGRAYRWEQRSRYTAALDVGSAACGGVESWKGSGEGIADYAIGFLPNDVASAPLHYYFEALATGTVSTYPVDNHMPCHEPPRTETWETFGCLAHPYDDDVLPVASDRYNQATLVDSVTFDGGALDCGPGWNQGLVSTFEVSWSLTRLPDQDCDGIPDSRDAVATDGPCATTLEVRKDLDPVDDPGRFDLLIDHAIKKQDAGDGGTTGTQTVAAGDHSVAEIAGTPGTDLANYASSTVCRDLDSDVEVGRASGPGPLSVRVNEGDNVVCTITNNSNRPPVAEDDEFGNIDRPLAESDAPVALDVLAAHGHGADHDPDGDEVTITDATLGPGTPGTVVSLGNSLLYSPPEGYLGQVRFSYLISDGHGGTDSASVTARLRGCRTQSLRMEMVRPGNARAGEATFEHQVGWCVDGAAAEVTESDVAVSKSFRLASIPGLGLAWEWGLPRSGGEGSASASAAATLELCLSIPGVGALTKALGKKIVKELRRLGLSNKAAKDFVEQLLSRAEVCLDDWVPSTTWTFSPDGSYATSWQAKPRLRVTNVVVTFDGHSFLSHWRGAGTFNHECSLDYDAFGDPVQPWFASNCTFPGARPLI